MELDKIIDRPLTEKELIEAVDEKGWLERTVYMELSEIVNNDYDGFILTLSERVLGDDRLTDVTYSMAGAYYEFVLVRVCGTVEELAKK